MNYSFFAETRFSFCQSKNIDGGWYQFKKEIVRWVVFRLMSGEKNWLCFGLSLKELSQFVTNTLFDYSAKAQINLSDGINIICVYILNLSKHTFSRRSRSNITQKGHTNWNSTRKLKCLGINGEYHSSISATVVFVLKCVKKIEKCCCEYQRCIHSSLEMDISERVYWWYPLS